LHLRLAALLTVVLLAGGCGGGGENEASSQSAPGCTTVEAPEPREPEPRRAPTTEVNPELTQRAVVKTNCGEFTFTLDPHSSPNAVVSFVTLANAGYYDDTVVHRIIPEFVIQGGDPTASGAGGPGYTTVDTPAKDTQYTLGTVAMAKTAAEPRGAAGSQFFVVTGDELQLPRDYAVIGEVTSGLETVERIGDHGNSAGVPNITVVIESIKISRGS
jgi:cyclophilin family peptidyl-prolyl cis-trans isomerase